MRSIYFRQTAHKGLVALLLLFVGSLTAWAQMVTISPQSGKIISAKTKNTHATEAGFGAGFGAMWKHNQLQLTYTTSDNPKFSSAGVFSNHTCDIYAYSRSGNAADERIILIAGLYNVYSNISLPKGYRITKYEITIKNNLTLDQDGAVVGNKSGQAWASTPLTLTHSRTWKFGEVAKDKVPDNSPTGTEPTWLPGLTPISIAPYTPVDETPYTITRGNGTTDDLGSDLYFCFHGNGASKLAAITIESIKIWFAPDIKFSVPLSATNSIDEKVSLTENEFTIGRLDIDAIKQRTKGAKKFYAYDQENLSDALASVKLYQEGAVNNGTWDKASGQKTIASLRVDNTTWTSFMNGTYYAEAPTTINMKKTEENSSYTVPAGYRIVGAKFTASPGKAQSGGTSNGFYITSTEGSTTYYLNYKYNYGYAPYVAWSTTASSVWKQDSYGRIYTTVGTNNYYLYNYNSTIYIYTNKFSYWKFLSNGDLVEASTYYPVRKSGNATQVSYWTAQGSTPVKRQATQAGYTPQSYTVTIYGKNGTDVAQTLNIAPSLGQQTYELTDLNNDAVKFSISGLPAATEATNPALMNVEVILEPLNPFISNVNVVCKGKNSEEITRTFTSTDFQLGGEKFVYKVPKGFAHPESVQFSFRNLQSKYADDTYANCTNMPKGNSRYNFAASTYYNLVNDDLYANKDVVADHTYADKIDVEVVGNIPFKFNNMDELSNTSTSTVQRYLTEQLFTAAAYASMTGDVTIYNNGTPTTSSNVPATFSADQAKLKDLQRKNMYLFTTDETRYNIAPTTKEMHRAFAYYKTTIELQLADYTPKVTWKKIYDKTDYYKSSADKDNTEAMYGAVITTSENAGYDNTSQNATTTTGTASAETFGYLTLNQIKDAMTNALSSTDPEAPSSLSQVLYVDNSQLYTIVAQSGTETSPLSSADFRQDLAKNAIVYLPFRATAQMTTNNMGINDSHGSTSFTATQNFLLEDRNPFFAPYDIQLAAGNYATYQRKYTQTGFGATAYSTIVLPYSLSVAADGLHDGNNGELSKFKVYTMKPNGFSYNGNPERAGFDYNSPTAMFSNLTSDTEANTPYLVSLPYDPSNATVFEARQDAALIKATPTHSGHGFVKGTMVASQYNGTASQFTNYYTYSGSQVANDGSGDKIFYFSINRFLAVKNSKNPIIYIYPFRSVYEFGSTSQLLARYLAMFNIALDDNAGETTGITPVQEKATLAVTTARQSIIATASQDTRLTIYSVAGRLISQSTVKAGETRAFSVPSGVYIVNGKKITVE